MSRVLALDLASNIGWSSDMPSGDRPICGSFRVEWDSGESLGRALFDFRRQLQGLIALHLPETVCFEAPLTERLHGLNTSTLLLGLCAIAELGAFEAGLDCFSCDVETVRRHFVGTAYPKNPKVVVMERCRALGWNPKDYDSADSLAVWDYAKATLRAGEVDARAVHAARLA